MDRNRARIDLQIRTMQYTWGEIELVTEDRFPVLLRNFDLVSAGERELVELVLKHMNAYDLRAWIQEVVAAWEEHWRDKPEHRYGRDIHAFVGERLVTDFSLRGVPGAEQVR